MIMHKATLVLRRWQAQAQPPRARTMAFMTRAVRGAAVAPRGGAARRRRLPRRRAAASSSAGLPQVADTAAQPDELRAAPFSDAMVLDVRDPAELEKVGAVGAARRCAATIATDACAHDVGPAEAEHTQGKA